MKCPRCDNTTLDERDREGVTIDVCPTCRGVWLDRGELEKIITRTTQELDAYEKRDGSQQPPRDENYREQQGSPYREQQGQYRPRQDSDHDFDRHRGGYEHRGYKGHHKHKKRSFLESLGDIFD